MFRSDDDIANDPRLHKEVIDFYEHFRPRRFEQTMRQRLVDNLNKAMRRNYQFRTCEVKAFGSFMSGLYLPMADMDLVVCSDSLLSVGRVTQRLTSKSSLYRFRAFIQNEDIPVQGSIQVIAGARIPLVKYVDRATGLRVDISFENYGGVQAIDRFMSWRRVYPAMPILVTIIKQFLSMRELNEPVNGGIGGFSVICLVVSMLQLMPQVQSGDMVPEHHLGELLMEFFDLYGNQFRYEDVAIRLNPPGYVHKVSSAPWFLEPLEHWAPRADTPRPTSGPSPTRLSTASPSSTPTTPATTSRAAPSTTTA